MVIKFNSDSVFVSDEKRENYKINLKYRIIVLTTFYKRFFIFW